MTTTAEWTPLRTKDQKTKDYRVTVTKVRNGRFSGWNAYNYNNGTFRSAFMGMIFGNHFCVSIYDHGRFVGRERAGRWLHSPQRVAKRMMRQDMEDGVGNNPSDLYGVKYSVS